ncbi:uncharacterized protein LOC118743759 [Rhagoletis pomonella]|uniref:uncharacterized protein LOC118743759 n=1 Tax=Rhagoletis pomonella TaxID=28610 RepID=UPI00178357D9|nr:uncharacterized protein LOC118743759 [Rhagoletis pomonella]
MKFLQSAGCRCESKMGDSSPAPSLYVTLKGVMDEILNDSEEENVEPGELKKFYESAMDILDMNGSPSTSRNILRALPSDHNSSCTENPTTSRKRQRNPCLWKQNIRTRLRESGKPYTDRKGKQRGGRKLGSPCADKCLYQCNSNFTGNDRTELLHKFWNLNNEEKKSFLFSFVKPSDVKRRRKSAENTFTLRKKRSFYYYFRNNDTTLQVCKKFFLSTLDISERRIYYLFNVSTDEQGVPSQTRKNHGRPKTSPNKIQEIKEHILSFPTINSHYCRSSTSRKYLESHLSVKKMYDLYREKHNEHNVSLNVYRNVFNYSFNLSFYSPKKDQCDRCVWYKVNEKECSQDKKLQYCKHVKEKQFCKAEREKDRQNIDPSLAILCYDLENIITLPKCFASNFYYRRKLCVFNLTGTLIKANGVKETYCALWDETCGGRGGNAIASALIKILDGVEIDHPEIKKIILWSDSCIPQNRNQITSTAILFFLNKSSITSITQKFSEPGHSCIQEVDCVHSTIDKTLRKIQIPSPIALVQILKNLKYPKTHLKILQMAPDDFKNYSQKAGLLNFNLGLFRK